MMRKYIFFGALVIFFLSGCAGAPVITPVKRDDSKGTYHRVEKGETLWRISKMYNMDLEELASVNRISVSSQIEVGQLLLIPFKKQYCPTPVKVVNEDFIWPLKGKVITGFGTVAGNMVTKGINIQPYSGSDDVVAARAGKVVFYSPDFESYGKTVIIDHGDGFLSVYARNAQVFVKVGEQVSRGMAIAKPGFAGRDKARYLHFQIRKGVIPQNPNFYLP